MFRRDPARVLHTKALFVARRPTANVYFNQIAVWGQSADEFGPIFVIGANRFPPIASAHDVMTGAWIFNS